jgi:hypothetical protein
MPTFYFDSSSFITARALYTDSELKFPVTTNGWYSLCGYARQITGGNGVLGPVVSCLDISAGCVVPCQTGPPLSIKPLVDVRGVFDTQVDISQKTGAIRIEMVVKGNNNVAGFFAQLGVDTYPNTLSRRQFKSYPGATAALSKPYITGSTFVAGTCNPPGNIVTLDWYIRSSGGSWTPQVPVTKTEYVTGSDPITANTTLVMYVPKPNLVPSILYTRIIQGCAGFTDTEMKVYCPDPLYAVNCSAVSTSATGGGDPACPKALTKPLYQGPVAGTIGAFFGVGDWVFSDANSENIPLDGFYKTAYTLGTSQWIQVSGGIVIAQGVC